MHFQAACVAASVIVTRAVPDTADVRAAPVELHHLERNPSPSPYTISKVTPRSTAVCLAGIDVAPALHVVVVIGVVGLHSQQNHCNDYEPANHCNDNKTIATT